MIHVSFTIEDLSGNYSGVLACALESLLKNTREELCIHLLHDERWGESNKQKIDSMIKGYGQSVKYYQIKIDRLFFDIFNGHLSPGWVCLFRLYLPSILAKDISKVIFMDCDIILNCDVADLWKEDLEGCSLGAVVDEGLRYPYFVREIRTELNSVVDTSNYFNAGIMVLDIDKIRKNCNLLEEAADYFVRHPRALYRDQDALNFLFGNKNDVKLLDGRYNMLTRWRKEENYNKLQNGIYHWAGVPYNEIEMWGNNPFDDMFWQCMKNTPWKEKMALYAKPMNSFCNGISGSLIHIGENKTKNSEENNPDRLSAAEKIEQNSFGNIGDDLFKMAVYRSVDWSNCSFVSSYEEADLILLHCANQLSNYAIGWLEESAIFLREKAIKTVVVGIGIESTAELNDDKLKKACTNFVDAVISTGGCIGVRGDVTYKFLTETLGYKEHIYNLGCPSMRYYGKKFPKMKKKVEFNYQSKVAVNFTPYSDSHELTAFFDCIWRKYPASRAIMQDQCEGLLMMKGVAIEDYRVRSLLPSYKQHFMFQQGRCDIFPVIHEWIGNLRFFDFVIGSRLHGCIAGILAGVPTLLLANTERQIEVAKFNGIPYIRSGIISRDTPLEELYEFACENWDEMTRVYRGNLKIYTDFLEMNGIPVNEDFL